MSFRDRVGAHSLTPKCTTVPSISRETPRRLPFLVGGGVADITPPLDVGLLMSSVERRWAPFESVQLPLHARALAVESRGRRIVIVSLELLGLTDVGVGGIEQFRGRVIAASGDAVAPENLVLTSVHTHTAPETLALSDLHHTPAYKRWLKLLSSRIGAAIRLAVQAMRPRRMVCGTTDAKGLAIHRRIKTTRGILLSHPEPPKEIVISREGAVDHSVQVAAFLDDAGRPRGILVNAACHPVHEMCLPHVSPDYPGIMSNALEQRHDGSTVLFLNGAAGNVNPPTVSGGLCEAERHGLRLAEIVDGILGRLRPAAEDEVAVFWERMALAARAESGKPGESLKASVAVARIGEAAFVFLPGEPFAETGLAIRAASPFPFTAVVGYAEGSIGYIPTDEAFKEGGYETSVGAWSRVAIGSEKQLRHAAIALLRTARHDRSAEREAATQVASK